MTPKKDEALELYKRGLKELEDMKRKYREDLNNFAVPIIEYLQETEENHVEN